MTGSQVTIHQHKHTHTTLGLPVCHNNFIGRTASIYLHRTLEFMLFTVTNKLRVHYNYVYYNLGLSNSLGGWKMQL